MKVLIVSEGKHELHGALETLVRRLIPVGIRCDSSPIKSNDIHVHFGKGGGYFKKAIRWMMEAEKRGYDAVVLVVDEDHRPERRREIERAQNDGHSGVRRALGVAIRTFDAWMLADERALTAVLGCSVQRQRDPETLRNAKDVFEELLSRSGDAKSQRDAYLAVTREADIAVMEKRCRNGFAPFAERVRRLGQDGA